jgi:predicted alpha/beta hydrolase family esterase
MIARLQQFVTFALIAVALLWALAQARAGRPVWAVLGVVTVLGFHAVVLAVELALLRHAHGDDPTPRATPSQLLRAWWDESVSAVRVFAWQQPFRSRLWPDAVPPAPPLPAAGASSAHPVARRGVLLVHGFVCNRGFWNRWMARLHAQGTPYIALTLEPAFGSIDAYIAQIDAAVQRLRAATGAAPVIVAHSMGGLAVRRWLAEATRQHGLSPYPVHHVITLGSPHHGTWLAKLAMTRNTRQMQQLSGWLQTLAQREAPGSAQHFTCFYSHCDNIVFPPSTATLPGACNVHLPGVAHVHMAERPEPWQALQARLADPLPAPDGAAAARPTPALEG